jgi:DNA-binding IclR family transcriptional regulator
MTRENPKQRSADGSEVQAGRTMFAIIEHLEVNGPSGVTEISDALGMSKGGVHRYLKTLVNEGYAVNDEGTYRLGLRFLTLGGVVRQNFTYTEIIEQKTTDLSEETGQRVQFLAEEHGYGIYLYRERDPKAAQFEAAIGRRVALHTTAAGKAILAHLSRPYVEEIIEWRGLQAETENSITDRETLFETLEDVREKGYAVNEGEHLTGVNAIGVPIFDPKGDVLGGMSVSGPSQQMDVLSEENVVKQALLSTAEEIELELKYS